MNGEYMSVPADVGCSNDKCIKSKECQRTVIFENKTAREVRSFGGTPDKGCGKFIPRKDK